LFFKPTGIEIAGESSGRKQMDIKQEKYTTGFGQSSAITPVQLIQAFSAITNKGKMMKPYITSKITDSKGEIVKEFKPIQVGTPISPTTADKMLNLMKKVVEDPRGTGYRHYRIQDYTIAGKTGTAEYVENGRYLSCQTCYYTSFLMAAPSNNPDIIVYLVTKHDASPSYADRGKFIKNVSSNVLAYLNSKPDKVKKSANKEVKSYEMESFINKSVSYSIKKLSVNTSKYVILGSGNKVVNQSPLPYSMISNEQRVFLLTNDTKYQMIDLKNYSKSDVLKYASLLNLKVNFKGNGYVSSQSISVGKTLNAKDVLTVTLE
jgi:penicillin-binding protein 2B